MQVGCSINQGDMEIKQSLDLGDTARIHTGHRKVQRNRKHMCCSRDAEANDMIHIGRDHRSVMAQFVSKQCSHGTLLA